MAYEKDQGTVDEQERRVRRLETLLAIDDRLSKLEGGRSDASEDRSRFGRGAPLIALLSIVAPVTSAVYGLVSGVYAQRLQREQAIAERMDRYLAVAIDVTKPLETRRAMLQFIEATDNDQMKKWAGGESKRIQEGIGDAEKIKSKIEDRLEPMRAEYEALMNAIERQEGEGPNSKDSDNKGRLNDVRAEITQEEQQLVNITQKISDVPVVSEAEGAVNPAPPDDSSEGTMKGSWYIQLATNADEKSAKYDLDRFPNKELNPQFCEHDGYHVIYVGGFATRDDAIGKMREASGILNRGGIIRSFANGPCPNEPPPGAPPTDPLAPGGPPAG